MNEQTPLPLLDDAPNQPIAAPETPNRRVAPWLIGLGFLLLAAAIFWVWQNPNSPANSAADATATQAAANAATIQGIQQRLVDLDGRLTRLEHQPTANVADITSRFDALDGRVADQAQTLGRLDALSGRVETLSARDQAGLDANKQKLDTLTSRLATIEVSANNVDVVARHLKQVARLQEASFALTSGRPIGDLPNAPEALARYAHAVPPTDAQLHLRFSQDEQVALAANPPDASEAPLVDRALNRAQALITIRRGDKVVVGDLTAKNLGLAQVALNAGDLAGAVKAVEELKGTPAQVMASWLADAKGLLNARSALTDMADQA